MFLEYGGGPGGSTIGAKSLDVEFGIIPCGGYEVAATTAGEELTGYLLPTTLAKPMCKTRPKKLGRALLDVSAGEAETRSP